VRGRGLWVGVELDPEVVSARAACEELMAQGVLTKDTHGTVLRFAPPLTIARDELDWGLDRVERVLTRIAA
jgi:ornithine--oxo-acid transaminase